MRCFVVQAGFRCAGQVTAAPQEVSTTISADWWTAVVIQRVWGEDEYGDLD